MPPIEDAHHRSSLDMPDFKPSTLPDNTRARISGVLFLLIFVVGVTIYQVLRGPIAFGDDFLFDVAAQRGGMIGSVLLAFLTASLTIVVSVLLLPTFKRSSPFLARLYVAFCVVNFVAIALENQAALALLDVSAEYVEAGASPVLESIGAVAYEAHRRAHLLYLLLSCLPVFVLYAALYRSRLVPGALGLFGMFAAAVMATDTVATLLGGSLSDYALIPIAFVQLTLPLWLIVRGFRSTAPHSSPTPIAA